MNSVSLIPAILATDEAEYKNKASLIELSNLFKDSWVQIDFMDNIFVQNKSIEPDVVKKYALTSYKEAQLMVAHPLAWVSKVVDSGFERIIFPVEVGQTLEVIAEIKRLGKQVGISVNPRTSVAKLREFIDRIDLILIMSVNPGFGGQEFITDSLQKVKQASEFKQMFSNLSVEVDGGITPEIAAQLIKNGADSLVVGSRLTQGDIAENLENFWQAIYAK